MLSIVLLIFLLFLILSVLLVILYIYTLHTKYQHIPGPPRPSFLLGHLRHLITEYRRDNTGFSITSEYFQLYGRVYVLWFALKPIIIITDPTSIRETVQSGAHPKMENNPIGHLFNTRFVGTRSIFTNPGDGTWKSNRRAYNRCFSRAYLKRYHDVVTLVAGRLVAQLNELCEGDVVVDMNHWINLAACDVIGLLAFDWDIDSVSQRDGRFAELLDVAFRAVAVATGLPFFSRFLPSYRDIRVKARHAIAELRLTCAQQIVHFKCVREQQSEYEAKDGFCVLDEILNQTPDELEYQVDEMLAFFLAGQETVAHILTFSLSHIMRDRSLIDMCERDVREYMGDPTFENLAGLDSLDKIMKETLRLYAPVPGLRRVLSKDTIIWGYNIPAGTTLIHILNLYSHDQEIWGSDHLEFNPRRFDTGNFSISKRLSPTKVSFETTVHSENNRHPHSFLPFGIGPRVCIGKEVAKVEFKILICHLLSNFKFTPVAGEDIKQIRLSSVKPKSGYKCYISRLSGY